MKTFWKILLLFLGTFFAVFLIMFAALLLTGFSLNELPVFGQKVTVIPIKGEITLDGCAPSLLNPTSCASASAIKEALKTADADPSTKAIVLDINSPGGSAVASSDIARTVKGMKKPVVACIREQGASGAYFIASASDHIVADRDSMTGSLGVIMTFQQMYGLYEKLGLNVTVIKSGKVKDIGSPYREMTPEETKELKVMVDKIYLNFVSDIAANRNLSVGYVKSISDGSIYLGSEARDMGLVDSLGSIDDAITIASDMGQISGRPSVQETQIENYNLLDLLS